MEKGQSRSNLDSSYREVSISYLAGTIDKEEILSFRRLLFRVTRGKALTYFEDLSIDLTDYSGEPLNKCIYVVVYHESY